MGDYDSSLRRSFTLGSHVYLYQSLMPISDDKAVLGVTKS
jgi:hypothetical protein